MDLLNAIERLAAAESNDKLFQRFESIMGAMGFDRIFLSFITDHPQLNQKAQHAILKNYPDDSINHYIEQNYSEIISLRLQAMQRIEPYTWDSLLDKLKLSKTQQQLFQQAENAGLLNGVAVPLQGPCGAIAAMGLASTAPSEQRDQTTLLIIQSLCQQFYQRYWVLNAESQWYQQFPELTGREADVLRWLAQGYSQRETSCLLSLSVHTVDYHVRNILEKFNAPNITAAVYFAVSQGLLPGQSSGWD